VSDSGLAIISAGTPDAGGEALEPGSRGKNSANGAMGLRDSPAVIQTKGCKKTPGHAASGAQVQGGRKAVGATRAG
jgi:hypothetical protein